MRGWEIYNPPSRVFFGTIENSAFERKIWSWTRGMKARSVNEFNWVQLMVVEGRAILCFL
jgi:hypothetical protein